MIRPLAHLFAGVLALLLYAATARADDPPLVRLAEIGPWPAVSALIGFADRLWFANSVKYVNHNSADLYSYDPASGQVRYERHLFSQDVGEPAVLGGRLYWPFEDPRSSAGVGEFMATDGTSWDWRAIPGALAFHAQAFVAHEGALYAGLSAWQAVITRSDDGGVTWRPVYLHPTPEKRVSRITTFAALDGRLYAGVTAAAERAPKLLVQDGDTFRPIAGWPDEGATIALVAFKGFVYGAVWRDGGASTWRTDGAVVEAVPGLAGARAFAVLDGTLYAAAGDEREGRLLASDDGLAWRVVQTFDGARPIALAAFAGGLYAGTEGPGATGALWGPPPDGTIALAAPAPLGPLPDPLDAFASDEDALQALDALDQRLGAIETYGHHFAARVEPFARSRRAVIGPWLEARLGAAFPEGEVGMFGGGVKIRPRDIGRWYMMRTMGLNGHGRVPPALIAEPLRTPRNQAEKYFDIAPLAIWVAGVLRQDDRETIAALIARLDDPTDPPWLVGDIVGTLTALSGQRFRHDRAAWRDWWQTLQAAGSATP